MGDFKTKFGARWYKFWHKGAGKIEKNEFGEWSVSMGKVTEDKDGHQVFVSWLYYGKGRRRTTAAGEYWRDQEEMREDIMLKGERSIYKEFSSQAEASEAA